MSDLICRDDADPRNLANPRRLNGVPYTDYERGYNDGIIDAYWVTRRAKPVLRCEKCRYYFSLDDGDICRRPGLNGEIVEMPVTPDGYCAWGESRDGSI